MAEKLPHIYSFCNEPIEWHSPVQPLSDTTRLCHPVVNNQDLPYRFAVSIVRENFPPDKMYKVDSAYGHMGP